MILPLRRRTCSRASNDIIYLWTQLRNMEPTAIIGFFYSGTQNALKSVLLRCALKKKKEEPSLLL